MGTGAFFVSRQVLKPLESLHRRRSVTGSQYPLLSRVMQRIRANHRFDASRSKRRLSKLFSDRFPGRFHGRNSDERDLPGTTSLTPSRAPRHLQDRPVGLPFPEQCDRRSSLIDAAEPTPHRTAIVARWSRAGVTLGRRTGGQTTLAARRSIAPHCAATVNSAKVKRTRSLVRRRDVPEVALSEHRREPPGPTPGNGAGRAMRHESAIFPGLEWRERAFAVRADPCCG